MRNRSRVLFLAVTAIMAASCATTDPARAPGPTDDQQSPRMEAPPGLSRERLDKLPLAMQTRANFNVKAVPQTTPEYQEIRTVVDGLVRALSTKSAELSTRLRVDDSSLVYYGPPQVTVRTKGSRQYAMESIACLQGFDRVEVRPNDDMEIRLSGPLAVVTLTGSNRLFPRQGNPTESKWRWTLGMENTNGQWLVAHEHFSLYDEPTAIDAPTPQ